MSSGNGDGPFRSSRTAPKWLPCGIGKGLSPLPSRSGRFRRAGFVTAFVERIYYTCFDGIVNGDFLFFLHFQPRSRPSVLR